MKSESEARAFERVRRQSFNRARQLVAKGVDVNQKVLGAIPADKQEEIRRRIRERERSGSKLVPAKAPSTGGSPLNRK